MVRAAARRKMTEAQVVPKHLWTSVQAPLLLLPPPKEVMQGLGKDHGGEGGLRRHALDQPVPPWLTLVSSCHVL